jgi:hypothetical protein
MRSANGRFPPKSRPSAKPSLILIAGWQEAPNRGRRTSAYNLGNEAFSTYAWVSASIIFAAVAHGQSTPFSRSREQPATIRTPPPPRPEVDPQPGPFIVHLDEQGNVAPEQFAVIANAVRVWAVPGLEAFSVCYGRGPLAAERVDTHGAVKSVAVALQARGALVVVMPNGGLCDPAAPQPVRQSGHYVTIMGVIAL